MAKKKNLGKFYFRKPYLADTAFTNLLGINAVIQIFRLISNLNSHQIDLSNNFSIISGVIDAVFGVFLSLFLTWIIALFYLIPRRRKDLRIVSTDAAIDTQVEESNNLATDIISSETLIAKKSSKLLQRLPLISVILVITVIIIGNSLLSNRVNAADQFLKDEKKVSNVVGKWNVAVSPLSETIVKLSSNSISLSEAIANYQKVKNAVLPIQNELATVCGGIKIPKNDGKPESEAFSKVYEMITVTCEAVPQEFSEAVGIFVQYTSGNPDLSIVNSHANNLSALEKRRKDSIITALDAMTPYLNSAQNQQVQQLRQLVTESH